jgi:hypothetical protein
MELIFAPTYGTYLEVASYFVVPLLVSSYLEVGSY